MISIAARFGAPEFSGVIGDLRAAITFFSLAPSGVSQFCGVSGRLGARFFPTTHHHNEGPTP